MHFFLGGGGGGGGASHNNSILILAFRGLCWGPPIDEIYHFHVRRAEYRALHMMNQGMPTRVV